MEVSMNGETKTNDEVMLLSIHEGRLWIELRFVPDPELGHYLAADLWGTSPGVPLTRRERAWYRGNLAKIRRWMDAGGSEFVDDLSRKLALGDARH
jgi:hypothetical protein